MKDWRDDLVDHVERWSAKLKKAGREWWPKFVYHFTDLNNARAILNSGELLSRAAVDAKPGGMPHDNANQTIIAQTRPEYLRLVRLFFRPKTPTQYVNEGIQVPDRRGDGHCPVPVFLLFDLVDLISRDDASFSSGTLASRRFELSNERDDFHRIDFEDVYHQGSLGVGPSEKKRRIKQARMAEVVVPDRLELGSELKLVCCRSEAERATLLYGLDPAARRRWNRRIRTGIDSLFYRRFTYVRNVSGSDGNTVTFQFGRISPWEHHLDFRFTADSGNTYSKVARLSPRKESVSFKLPRYEDAGVARLELDACLAFEGRVLLSDLPF